MESLARVALLSLLVGGCFMEGDVKRNLARAKTPMDSVASGMMWSADAYDAACYRWLRRSALTPEDTLTVLAQYPSCVRVVRPRE